MKLSAFRFTFLSFIIWRTVTLGAFWIGISYFPIQSTFFGGSSPSQGLLLRSLSNFDGTHYLSIATQGYQQYEQAFFPFYPILMRFVSFFTFGDVLIAGLIISHLSLLGALWFLYRVVDDLYGAYFAKRTVVALLVFPTSFFLGTVYTESLFLLLVCAFFYFLFHKRFLIMGIMGAIASSTRYAGVLLAVAAFFECWRGSIHYTKRFWWGVFFTGLGLVGYMFYLFITVSDPLAFIHTQSIFQAGRSGDSIVLLPQVVVRYLKIFVSVSPYSYQFWISLFEFTVTLTFLSLSVLAIFRRMVGLGVFSFLTILLPTLSGTFLSIPRFAIVCIGVYVYLAIVLSPFWYRVYFVCSLFLLILCSVLFAAGFWIS